MAINEDEKKIVIARLESFPPDLEVSIGDYGTFDKEELIENVNKETEIGKVVVDAYMHNIRSFKEDLDKVIDFTEQLVRKECEETKFRTLKKVR